MVFEVIELLIREAGADDGKDQNDEPAKNHKGGRFLASDIPSWPF
jgi:hypothetical protein